MKRILHIFDSAGVAADACGTIIRHLATVPDIEQRIFRSGPPRYMERLRREIRGFCPEFIHLHAPCPSAAVCLPSVLPRGVKLIVHWHYDFAGTRNHYTLLRPFERMLLRRADVVVGTSRGYIEGSRALEHVRGKCVVIPEIVDFARLTPRRARVDQIRWRYGDKPLLLFSWRHSLPEGLKHLLAAVAMMRCDCRLVVGGDWPLTQRLRDDHVSGRIHFTGEIPDDDLGAWYTAADVFLLPSLDRGESFGPELAGAMWCGTPAVTFTVPGSGVNWVNLNGVTGIEVDNGNVGQLAAAIDHLLAHDDMRREYGQNARRRVEENMTVERIAPALEALYA